MALTVGTRIGPFLVKSRLGEGGMGVVFRALDTKLQRDVALKLLPDHFADDPDRLARFQREAQVLASLNHPNIAQIYGLEESDNTRCIVMELVEGQTLQERLKRGPIPIDEALPIAKQIAEALEAAHERGVVHRDLKPANIKLTRDGKVKVLDFGLAKAFLEQQATTLSNSPTLMSASVPGTILGTAAYMSPEQARGKEAERTSDIWAFGCVLYEMLTGCAVFGGETIGEILGGVFKAEPDWRRMPVETPEAIRRLLRRCLQKERNRRLKSADDVRIEIEESLSVPPEVTPPTVLIERKSWVSWIVASTAAIAFASIAIVHFREKPIAEAPEIRLEINTPPATGEDALSLAISPDGQKIIFVGTSGGRPALWLRSLDSVTARSLTETEGASMPFWSPDSRSIGFFADNKLKRIDIDGGLPQVLTNANGWFSPGTWNSDGVILYSPVPGRPILRVSATGGPSEPVTRIEERGQTGGHTQPTFLPDGHHFLYTVAEGGGLGVYVGQLGRTETRRMMDEPVAPVYVSGHILFVRRGVLFAQKFDLGRLELTGTPFQVAEHVLDLGRRSAVGASNTSTIAYRNASGNPQSQFLWLDRFGKEIGRVGDPDPGLLSMPSISSDGRRLAFFRQVNGNDDVWFLDLARGVANRFTSDPANDVFPVWSPDGTHIAFSSTRIKGAHDLYYKAVTGATTEELLLATSEDKFVSDWSPDGRYLLYSTYDAKTQHNIWALPLSDPKPFPVVQTEFEERNGQFSPDGKWIAYQSNESGRFEIYVQPFPGPGAKSRISTSGGAQVRWRRDGKELFYIALDERLMAVPIRFSADGQSVEAGTPVSLFATHTPRALEHLDGQQYVISPDGQRFLINTLVEGSTTSPITVILNWKAKP